MSVLRADAPFFWPLRGSIALQNGSGSSTFTRATAKWMFNDEGRLIRLPSGAIEMRGYRPVINWFTDPNNISGSANWITSNVSKASATGPDGASSDGCLLTCTTNAANNLRQAYLPATIGGDTRTYRFLYKPGTAGWMRVLFYAGSTDRVTLWFNATTNTLGTVSTGGTGWASVSYALTASTQYPGWYEVYMAATTPTTGTHYMHLGFVDGDNSINTTAVNGLTLTIAQPMLEDSTGRTDKTPSEYVAGNNGAGANGVKYYATYKDGTPIPEANLLGAGLNPVAITNTLLYCRDLSYGGSRDGSNTLPKWTCNTVGPELISNGTFDSDTAGWTSLNATLSAVAGKLRITPTSTSGQARTTIATVPGTCYIVTVTLSNINGSALEHAVDVGSSAGLTDLGKIDCRSVVGSAPSFIFTAVGNTTYIGLRSPEGALYHEWDDVSVRKSAIQVSITGTGIDNQSNASSILTAAADNATISQTITEAASAGCSGFYVKRSVGTGAVYFSRNGGTDWLDITSQINASDFSLVKIENTSVTNPQIMFKIATSGDAIIVDAGINHLGSKIASCPILTTSVAVTVNAETLTYPTSANIYNSKGAILATFTADSYSSGMGNVVGSSTVGLATSSSYTCQAKDGTNTVNGAAIIPIGSMKIGMAWDSASGNMYALGETGIEATGVYDGNLGLATIGILPDVDGYIKDVAIFKRALTNAEVINVFNS